MFQFNKVNYGNSQNFAKHSGVSPVGIFQCIFGAGSFEKRICEKLGVEYTKQLIFFEGVGYPSLASLAEKLCIPEATLQTQLLENRREFETVVYPMYN